MTLDENVLFDDPHWEYMTDGRMRNKLFNNYVTTRWLQKHGRIEFTFTGGYARRDLSRREAQAGYERYLARLITEE